MGSIRNFRTLGSFLVSLLLLAAFLPGFADSQPVGTFKWSPYLDYPPCSLPLEAPATSTTSAKDEEQAAWLAARGLVLSSILAAEVDDMEPTSKLTEKSYSEKKMRKYLAAVDSAYDKHKPNDVYKYLQKALKEIAEDTKHARDIAIKRSWQAAWIQAADKLPFTTFRFLRLTLLGRGALALAGPPSADRADFSLELVTSLGEGESFLVTDRELESGLRQLVLEGTCASALATCARFVALGEGIHLRTPYRPVLQYRGLACSWEKADAFDKSDNVLALARALELCAAAGCNACYLSGPAPDMRSRAALEALAAYADCLGLTVAAKLTSSAEDGRVHLSHRLQDACDLGAEWAVRVQADQPRPVPGGFFELDGGTRGTFTRIWTSTKAAEDEGARGVLLPARLSLDTEYLRQLTRALLALNYAGWFPRVFPKPAWLEPPGFARTTGQKSD